MSGGLDGKVAVITGIRDQTSYLDAAAGQKNLFEHLGGDLIKLI
jgi:hypothetical protein